MNKEVLNDIAIHKLLQQIKEYDENTYMHSKRVSDYAKEIAEKFGMGKEKTAMIQSAALIHDIGKIKMPLSIIKSSKELTDEERLLINCHPMEGLRYLKKYYKDIPDIYINAVLLHHERADGSGYPYGITENQISIETAIIAVADVYDALISERPYKKEIPQDEVLRYFLNNSKLKFNQDVIHALVNCELSIKDKVS